MTGWIQVLVQGLSIVFQYDLEADEYEYQTQSVYEEVPKLQTRKILWGENAIL